jgi:hypothetical protein
MRAVATLLLACIAGAEIIDRVAVTVDKRVITESEIMRQIRITSFLNNEQPDFSASNKRATADRLVEQVLIRRELETTRYSTPPPPAATPEYDEMKRRFKDDAAYKQALARYGITDADVREALEWQTTLLDFIEQRFRPGIQIPESEIRDYYEQQHTANPGKLPDFKEAREDIEKILSAQRVDNALDRWLGQARTQSRIRYTQEVFR